MSAEEIREAFLQGPQQTTIAGIYSEMKALRAMLEESVSEQAEKEGKSE